jgi:hypothetical protein
MKRILIHALTILLLASCSSKESDPAPSIVGTWVQTSQEGSGCTNPADNWKAKCPAGEFCDTYTFILEGNKFTMSNLAFDPVNPLITGTYTISGDKLTLLYDDTDYSFECNFVLTSTTLTLTYKISSSACTITLTFLRQE